MIQVLLLMSQAGSQAIAEQLECQPDIAVTEDLPSDWGELVNVLRLVSPDVVVLEERVFGGQGLALAGDIARSGVAPAVVLVAVTARPDDVRVAARSGVRGYLVEDAERRPWPAIVRAVASGCGWLSPAAAQVLLDEFATSHEAAGRAFITLLVRLRSRIRLVRDRNLGID